MKDDGKYQLLDKYLDGTLDAKSAAEVHARLAHDPGFATLLNERKALRRWLRTERRRTALHPTLDKLGEQYFPIESTVATVPSKKSQFQNFYRYRAMAAGVVFLIGLAWWWVSYTPIPTYEAFAQHDRLDWTERNDAQAALRESAQTAFNERQYERAYESLKILNTSKPEEVSLQLALGIAALETGRLEEARTLFDAIKEGDSAFREQGIWYYGLVWIKEDNFEAAKAYFTTVRLEEERLENRRRTLLDRLN